LLPRCCVCATNWNHETTHDEVCRSDELVHQDGAIQHGGAKRRLEGFLVKGKVCHLTFGFDLSDLAQGELGNLCQLEAHAFSNAC